MFSTLLMGSALAAGQLPAIPPVPQAMPGRYMPVAAQPAPMPAPAGPAAPAAEPAKEEPKKDEEKKEDEKKEEEKKETKYALEKLLEGSRAGQLLADHGIKVYGWAAMNYTGSSARRSNFPVALNDRANFFQLNQNYVVVEKGVDTTKKEVQYGFQTDFILPGTDARFTVVRGLFDNQLRNGPNGGPRDYPIDIYQMYTQVFLPDLGGQGTTVKLGRFNTHCEYEVIQAPLTPFVSRSYLFQYNPFTHTGVWATTQVNDTWSVSNGLATGSDTFIDPANRLTYLGQVKWAPKDGKTSLALNAVVTNPKFFAAENFAFYNVYNVQLTHKFTDKLTYVLDSAFSHMDQIPGVGSANWYGFVNYLLYQMNDKLASNFRVELFEDSKGVRTGTRGLYTELTYGLTWTPKDFLVVRPFTRYDHNVNGPFEGRRNLYTGGLEVIFRY